MTHRLLVDKITEIVTRSPKGRQAAPLSDGDDLLFDTVFKKGDLVKNKRTKDKGVIIDATRKGFTVPVPRP